MPDIEETIREALLSGKQFRLIGSAKAIFGLLETITKDEALPLDEPEEFWPVELQERRN